MTIATRARAIGLAAVLAGATVVAPLVAAPASADAGGNPALQFCRVLQQFYPGNITGACTSEFVSRGNAAAVDQYFCKYFIVPEGIFPTVGRCVSVIERAQGVS